MIRLADKISLHSCLQTDGRLNFATFSLHMAAGTVFALVAAYGLLRVIYYKKELLRAKDPPDIAGKYGQFSKLNLYFLFDIVVYPVKRYIVIFFL